MEVGQTLVKTLTHGVDSSITPEYPGNPRLPRHPDQLPIKESKISNSRQQKYTLGLKLFEMAIDTAENNCATSRSGFSPVLYMYYLLFSCKCKSPKDKTTHKK